MKESTLDCQDCGAILRVLSTREAQRVADDPYLFVVYCAACRRERQRFPEDAA